MSGICIDGFLVVGADWISQASMLISYLGKTDRFPVVSQPQKLVANLSYNMVIGYNLNNNQASVQDNRLTSDVCPTMLLL